jgi:hypothetical protein
MFVIWLRTSIKAWRRYICLLNGQNEGWEGRKVKDVRVMKDEELKLEEIEGSHTIGGVR